MDRGYGNLRLRYTGLAWAGEPLVEISHPLSNLTLAKKSARAHVECYLPTSFGRQHS